MTRTSSGPAPCSRPWCPTMADPRSLTSVVFVTGTGTEVGKTVATAALAAVVHERGSSVAAVKPAQTGLEPGEPGDVDEVRRLAGDDIATHEPCGCATRSHQRPPRAGPG